MAENIIVLGGGLVGGPMALDLARDERFTVTVADIDPGVLDGLAARGPVTGEICDLSDPASVADLVRDFDLVVGAVPGHLGFATLEAVISAGRDIVDIAFFPEDPFLLDAAARARGVTAIVDCGVFPGMGSALIGRADRQCESLDRVLVYVGGLPRIRRQPFEYRAVFSPIDVIEEYTRPARYRENGKLIERPALSDVELIELSTLGTLEAFNTDGLRTLLETISAPDMKEKTLRYPGHAAKMALLRECGFFSEDAVDVGGHPVRPVDVTGRLLFPMWKLQPGEGDVTVMRILVEGVQAGRRVRWTWDLYDEFDHALGVSSMARTTGYTATMVVRAIADGVYREQGVSPPEFLGRVDGCVEYMLAGLEQRGVVYQERLEFPD
ncbi:MAG: saccharopine dehydrogenase C-terminal domain-containing protein [bacterium]